MVLDLHLQKVSGSKAHKVSKFVPLDCKLQAISEQKQKIMNPVTVGTGFQLYCCTDSICRGSLLAPFSVVPRKTIWGSSRHMWGTYQHFCSHPELISLSRCLTHKCQDFSALFRNHFFFCSSLQRILHMWKTMLSKSNMSTGNQSFWDWDKVHVELLPQKLLPCQSHCKLGIIEAVQMKLSCISCSETIWCTGLHNGVHICVVSNFCNIVCECSMCHRTDWSSQPWIFRNKSSNVS